MDEDVGALIRGEEVGRERPRPTRVPAGKTMSAQLAVSLKQLVSSRSGGQLNGLGARRRVCSLARNNNEARREYAGELGDELVAERRREAEPHLRA